MSYHAWFEHFKDKLQGLSEAFETSNSPLSLLGYTLKENHLSSEEYLAWAMTHHRLPRLQARFFKETPPNQEMFAKWATHYPWSEECLPVAEWDGALIVACLQPPQDFPSTPASTFVLASPDDLEKTWKILNIHVPAAVAPAIAKKAAASKNNAPKSDAPEGIDLSAPAAAGSKNSDSFSFEDLGSYDDSKDESSSSDDSEEIAEIEAAGESDGLSGIFESTSIIKLEKSEAAPSENTHATKPSIPVSAPVKESALVTSEKSVLVATAPVGPATPPPSSAVVDDDSFEKTALMKIPDAIVAKNNLHEVTGTRKIPLDSEKTKSELIQKTSTAIPLTPTPATSKVVSASASVAKPIPPPPAKSAAASADEKALVPPPFEDSSGNKTIPLTVAPRPVGVAKPTLNPVSSGGFYLERIKKKNSNIPEKVKYLLSEMKAYFEKSMIVTLDDQETQIIAFAWDENFENIKDTSLRVPLKTPSIFNIVASTQKPYHGYISLNEVNEKFFDDWNQGRIPDHVTITPLIIDEKLVGMVVGFAEKAAFNKASLALVEKLSSDFVKGLNAA